MFNGSIDESFSPGRVMTSRAPEEFLPLTPLWFNILLAAADGPTHGYAIIKEIEQRTSGTLTPGTGTVYVALQRLVQEGLLVEILLEMAKGRQEYDDRRVRRHYQLSDLGRETCTAEARRLAGQVEAALGKKILKPADVRTS